MEKELKAKVLRHLRIAAQMLYKGVGAAGVGDALQEIALTVSLVEKIPVEK